MGLFPNRRSWVLVAAIAAAIVFILYYDNNSRSWVLPKRLPEADFAQVATAPTLSIKQVVAQTSSARRPASTWSNLKQNYPVHSTIALPPRRPRKTNPQIQHKFPHHEIADIANVQNARRNSRQINSSSPEFSPSFKIDIITKRDVPIDSEEIYRAAIDMMYKVSDFPLTQEWPNMIFPSPIGPARIMLRHSATVKEASLLNTHTIIWGLNHLLLSMKLAPTFCQTKAILKYDGEEIGSIEAVPRSSMPFPVHDPATANPTDESQQQLPRNASARNTLTHPFDRLVTVKSEYGRKPIGKHLIYLTGIKAMGDAAELGLDLICPGMVTAGLRQTKWSLIREPGRGIPVFRAGYSRVAVYDALRRVVREQRYDELFVIVSFEGDVAAVGGFTGSVRKGEGAQWV